MTKDSESKEENITEDEAALYDRQIRLWGLDAQRRLRAASVLLIGMRGLGAEIAKNIVLAGIKSLTLNDCTNADEEDMASQFLIPHSEIGKNRAQASLERIQLLNPMVTVTADTDNIDDKNDEFFASFDVVCATGCRASTLKHLDAVCRAQEIKFIAGDVFGFYGYQFADLGVHHYAEDVPKINKAAKPLTDIGDGEPNPKKAKVEQEVEITTVKKTIEFPSLESALVAHFDSTTSDGKKQLRQIPNTFFITKVLLEFLEQHKRRPLATSSESDQQELSRLRQLTLEESGVDKTKLPEDFPKFCFGQLGPVCAVVGGILSQEIIKAVSQKDAPHNNFFFYNGKDDGGFVAKIGNL